MPEVPPGLVPGVIDRNLLDSRTQHRPLSTLQTLCLHALNIWKIDHLWIFENLSVLKLTSNNIEKIENLESLIHLRELNLSHNKICRLEGLEKLVNLENLLVHHNFIIKLEGLEDLQKLQLLALGHNRLTDRNDMLYLRKLKELRALSLEGNPLCEEEDYKEFTVAVLPDLRYLDYKLVHRPQDFDFKYRPLICRVEETECSELSTLEAAREAKERADLLRDAFVQDLEVDDLLDGQGPRWTAVMQIGGEEATAIYNEHREQVQKVCQDLQKLGLDRRKERKTEGKTFRGCWQNACDTNRNSAISRIDDFLSPKENIYRILRQHLRESEKRRSLGEDNSGVSEVIRETSQIYGRDTEDLWSELLDLEVELQEQLEALTEQFVRRVTQQAGSLVCEARSLLLRARDLEGQFHDRLQEPCQRRAANLRLQEVESGKLPPLTLLAKQALSDDEILGSWLRETHEARLYRIKRREERLEADTSEWLKTTTRNIEEEAFNRSRAQILEIINFIETQRREISDLQPSSLAHTGLL